MKILKIFLGYWLEIGLGIWIINADSIRPFLFYFFIIFLISSEGRTDYLRKIMRVFQAVNDGRFISITRKLGISDEELENTVNELEKELTDEQRESLHKDMRSLGL